MLHLLSEFISHSSYNFLLWCGLHDSPPPRHFRIQYLPCWHHCISNGKLEVIGYLATKCSILTNLGWNSNSPGISLWWCGEIGIWPNSPQEWGRHPQVCRGLILGLSLAQTGGSDCSLSNLQIASNAFTRSVVLKHFSNRSYFLKWHSMGTHLAFQGLNVI